jgi:hypothetical protein
MSSEEEVEVAAEEEDAAANVAAEASPMPMKLRALVKNLFGKILIWMFTVPSISSFLILLLLLKKCEF